MKNIFTLLLASLLTFAASAANVKISDLTSLNEASWATGDLFEIVDISVPQSKKTSVADFDGRYVLQTEIGAQTITFTNKTINADSNTVTNIENADIKAAAAIDATKLADGSVSSAELQFINTLSSNAQTQLDSKAENNINSFVMVSEAAAYGTEIGNKVVCFATLVDSAGSDISRVTDAVKGDYILINTAGMYIITLSYQASATATIAGISYNISAANTTASITALTYAQGRLVANYAVPNRNIEMNITMRMNAGDKVRAQTDGQTLPAATYLQYMIVRRLF